MSVIDAATVNRIWIDGRANGLTHLTQHTCKHRAHLTNIGTFSLNIRGHVFAKVLLSNIPSSSDLY